MEIEQAFQIIQNVINGAVQKGLFASVDDVTAAAIALKTIEKAITIDLKGNIASFDHGSEEAKNAK